MTEIETMLAEALYGARPLRGLHSMMSFSSAQAQHREDVEAVVKALAGNRMLSSGEQFRQVALRGKVLLDSDN